MNHRISNKVHFNFFLRLCFLWYFLLSITLLKKCSINIKIVWILYWSCGDRAAILCNNYSWFFSILKKSNHHCRWQFWISRVIFLFSAHFKKIIAYKTWNLSKLFLNLKNYFKQYSMLKSDKLVQLNTSYSIKNCT